ncbi:MAG: AMIN domain-containing protein [Deltaproteobacteria bacterium]|nr:AMIN domain-containing protein [Deltaproteobacteria bacterium]
MGIFLGLVAFAGALLAQTPSNRLDKVLLDDESTKLRIKIRGSEPPTFTQSSLTDPPRVVIEISDAARGDIAAVYDVDRPPVKKLTFEKADATTVRATVTFSREPRYSVTTKDNDVIIEVEVEKRKTPDPSDPIKKDPPPKRPKVIDLPPIPDDVDTAPVSDATKRLTWVGFHHAKDLSRIFVRTTAKVGYSLGTEKAKLVEVTLKQTKVARSNVTRFLDTSFFPSVVRRIETKATRKGEVVTIAIHLRANAAPVVKQRGEYLIFDFAAPAAKRVELTPAR